MRFTVALGLAALAATANGAIVGRQQGAGSSSGTGGNGGNGGAASPGSSPTSPTPTNTPPSSGGDTTVYITHTVTADAKSTKTTFIGSTSVKTLTDTSTTYTTRTVTSSDQETATKTVWSTTTVQIDKRTAPAVYPGPTPAITSPVALNNLAKRATTTSTTTVTVTPSAAVVTVSSDVVSTTVTTTVITSTDVETAQANAKTTTTVTSTRTVSAIVVTQTTSVTDSTSTSNPGKGGGGGGLSTGAKAGIGAGVGAVGLAVIGALLFFCCRGRNRSPKADPDMMAGASEVPVGPSGGRPMSHASSGLRNPQIRTPVRPSAPEGYRGTAMGDGRAGYAKPESYGSSYNPSRSTTLTSPPRNSGGADALPEHPTPESNNAMVAAAVPHLGSPAVSNVSPAPSKPEVVAPPQHFAHELGTDNQAANKWHNETAAEIDSQPVMGHQSGPVYEMSTDNYR